MAQGWLNGAPHRDEYLSQWWFLPILIATGRVHYSLQVGYHNIYPLRVFHTNFNWRFFTEIWMSPVFSVYQDSSNFFELIFSVGVWMISILPQNFHYPNPFPRFSVTVPSALTTIGITINFMFHCLFSSLARSTYSSIFQLSFIFYSMVYWNCKIHEMTNVFSR